MLQNSQLLLITLLLALLTLRISQNGLVKEPGGEPEIAGKLAPLRLMLVRQSEELLPQPQAGLLSGILLGEKTSLPTDFQAAIRNTSTIHMVVASGQNLTILSGLVLSLVGFLGRKKTVILTLVTSAGYALLTGLQLPIIRAGIMVVLAGLAQLFNREARPGFVLTVTALAMLIFNPNWLLSVSFQLSFLATLGVVVVAPAIIKRVSFLPGLIRQDLIVSACAQVLTWPVIASNFHQASTIGLLPNVLILWTIPLVMVSGTLGLLMSFVSWEVGQVLMLVPDALLTYFVYVVNFFNLPWSTVYVKRLDGLVWAGYYLVLGGLFLLLQSKNVQGVEQKESKVLS